MLARLKKTTKAVEWFIDGGARRIFIGLSIILLFVTGYFIYENHALKREIYELCILLEDYEGCRTESPYGDPPLKITFSDGRVAYVNFHSRSIPKNVDDYKKLPEIAQENMHSAFLNTLKSIVYAHLESVELKYARQNRMKIATCIFECTNIMTPVLGTRLLQFDFLEFCEPITRRKPE